MENTNHVTEDKIGSTEDLPWFDFPDVKNDHVKVPLGT